MKLGTLLLRNAAIGLSQLEGALRNQVLYGGRLGTNLVELGFIDLDVLSAHLAELSGFPVATPSLLDDADTTLLDKLGAEEAHRLRAVPLGYLVEIPDTIAVAMVDPTDTDALAAVGNQLGASVKPYIVPELRALYYLEKLFGLPRRARFIRTARTGSETDHDRRRSQPAQGIVTPPSFTLEPRSRRVSSLVPTGDAVPLAVTYGAACERIDTATHRDQIAEAFIDYAKGRCDALIVFLVRDGNALGWRGWNAPPKILRTPIEELSLPLGGVSSLQSAHDAGEAFVGAAPATARPVELKLWTALGTTSDPATVVVVPVLVKHRAVNLIYAHTLGESPPQAFVTELLDLAVRAQNSYLRLVKQARGS